MRRDEHRTCTHTHNLLSKKTADFHVVFALARQRKLGQGRCSPAAANNRPPGKPPRWPPEAAATGENAEGLWTHRFPQLDHYRRRLPPRRRCLSVTAF